MIVGVLIELVVRIAVSSDPFHAGEPLLELPFLCLHDF
jgi:hypothetical protein